jgi:hypothetical protein
VPCRTEDDQRKVQRYSRLAIQLVGAADTSAFQDLTVEMVATELRDGDIFRLLYSRLPASVWQISKLTDVDRHELAGMWRTFATAYDPAQFHVTDDGLLLLAAYLLHLIDIGHTVQEK